jgi:hypothetical protein
MRDTCSRNVFTDASSCSVQPLSIVRPPSVRMRRLNRRRGHFELAPHVERERLAVERPRPALAGIRIRT